MAELRIRKVYVKPKSEGWDYPVSELDYLLDQVADGDRESGSVLELYDGRLYEAAE